VARPPDYPRSETERLNLLVAYTKRNKRESQPQQDIVWSRFCALYLPDMVSHYLDPPPLKDHDHTDQEFATYYPLYNAYLEMMVQIQHIPYFVKYLRSNTPLAIPGKRLPSVLAQRLLDLAPYLDLRMRTGPAPQFFEGTTVACIQVLSTLLTIFVKVPDQNDVVGEEVRQGLLLWLPNWGHSTTSSDELKEMCMTTWFQLSPAVDMKREFKSMRRTLKNLDQCALPICSVKDDCKICAKCKTVSYCSVEHQRAHWNVPWPYTIGLPHKEFCHETQY